MVLTKGGYMADFFKPKENEEIKEETASEEAQEIEKIKIGESEYDPEELRSMVDVASKVRDYEKKSGTDFDNLTSEFGRRAVTIGELKKELEEAKSKKADERKASGEELSEDDQVRLAQEQARKLGIVTQKDLDDYFERRLSEREQAKDLLGSCGKMEKKLDGSDGRPAFKTKDILEHMSQTGIKNPQDAYDLKYKQELNEWRDNKLNAKKPSGLTTEARSTAGSKQPPALKITSDNLQQLIAEELA